MNKPNVFLVVLSVLLLGGWITTSVDNKSEIRALKFELKFKPDMPQGYWLDINPDGSVNTSQTGTPNVQPKYSKTILTKGPTIEAVTDWHPMNCWRPFSLDRRECVNVNQATVRDNDGKYCLDMK